MYPRDRDAFTAGLREIACWLDDHPEVPLPCLGAYAEGSDLPSLPIYLYGKDAKAQLAAITRAMGSVTKAPVTYSNGDERFQVWHEFAGGVVLVASADRDQVCTRVVTSVEDREVEEVVTPAVTRTVVKQVEVAEWRCEPLLAPGVADAALDADPDGVADAVLGALHNTQPAHALLARQAEDQPKATA
jgi:hypothetical protein